MSSEKIENTKFCTKCCLEKPATLEFFNKHQRGKFGLHSSCKKCRSQQRSKWYSDNPDYNKNYYKQNRKQVRSDQNNYASRNRSTKKEYDKARRKLTNKQAMERYHSDPIFRIKMIFRRRFSYFLQSNVTSQMEKYVGCTLEGLKSHLESLWLEGMTWENYGNPNGDHTNCWHIDHIIPISSFDYSDGNLEESLHECWHYTNLQPLWAKDNLSKSAKLL